MWSNKNEPFYESRVLARAHRPQLAQFEHILSLKAVGGLLFESTTNQPMNIKQVLRWIAERHFEFAHHVKLTSVMGDEIEFSKEEDQEACRLI